MKTTQRRRPVRRPGQSYARGADGEPVAARGVREDEEWRRSEKIRRRLRDFWAEGRSECECKKCLCSNAVEGGGVCEDCARGHHGR